MLAELASSATKLFGGDEDAEISALLHEKCTEQVRNSVRNSVVKQKRPAVKTGSGSGERRCWICEKEFILLVRPERICSCCSKSLCGSCSPHEMRLPCFALEEADQRVCIVCAHVLQECDEDVQKPNRRQLRERGLDDPAAAVRGKPPPGREDPRGGFRSVLGLGAVAELEIRASAPADPAEREIYFAQLMNSRRRVERDCLREVSVGGGGEEASSSVYIIDQLWFGQWKSFTEDDGPPPGPISNHRLVPHDTEQAHAGLQAKHYRCVHASTWRVLQRKYGGGPAISRAAPDVYAPPG